jgi:hypothetical protein
MGKDIRKTGIEERPLMSAIGKQFLQKREQPKQGGREHNAAVAILDVSGMHNGVE